MCTSIVLCYVYTGSCFEVKIEAVSDDINECPHDDTPCTGTLQMFSTFIYMNM